MQSSSDATEDDESPSEPLPSELTKQQHYRPEHEQYINDKYSAKHDEEVNSNANYTTHDDDSTYTASSRSTYDFETGGSPIPEVPWSHISTETLYRQLRDVQSRLKHALLDIEHLQHARISMENRWKAEAAQVATLKNEKAKLETEKSQVTQELEDLTQSLFEEANTLVASEAKARYSAELRVNRLEKELSANNTRLAEEMQQLQELKRKMEIMSLQQFSTVNQASAVLLADKNSFWSIFEPKDLQEIAYPELSFAESKKGFYRTISLPIKGKQEDKGSPVYDSVNSDHETNSSLKYTSSEESTEVQDSSGDDTSTQVIKQAVNETWLYSHFDTCIVNEFLQCLGRKGAVTGSAGLYYEQEFAGSSTTSLQLPLPSDRGSMTPPPHSSFLRPTTPNTFGTATAMKHLLGGKYSTSSASKVPAPIDRAFPGEYKKTKDNFIKKVYDEDIYPTLTFPLRTRQFVKQILVVLSSNKLTFEKKVSVLEKRESIDSSTQLCPISKSPLSTAMAIGRPATQKDGSDTASVASSVRESDEKIIRHPWSCEFCGSLILPLPSMFLDSFENHVLSVAHNDASRSGRNPCEAYQLVIEDSQLAATIGKSVFVIDTLCRNKIISVCDFFTFVRYYRAGFYQHLSNEALFTKWLHLKRNMFYARMGAAPYFVAHDVNKLVHLAESKISS